MYLFTLFSYSGMKPAKRITFEIQEYGIPQCLPLLEVSGQFFNGESFLPAYVRQVFPVCSGRVILGFRQSFAIAIGIRQSKWQLFWQRLSAVLSSILMFSYYIISYYLVQNYILFLILRIRKTVFCAFFNIVLNSMITNENK